MTISAEPKPAENADALKAPTVNDDKMAPDKKISESKVSTTEMPMPSPSVQCHIRTPSQ